MFTLEWVVYLLSGVHLPSHLYTRNELLYSLLQHSKSESFAGSISQPPDRLAVVLGHGLGSKDPRVKDHLHDEMISILTSGLVEWRTVDSVISYTARGHGRSFGWQTTAKSDNLQFTWGRLADDMIAVGEYYSYQHLIVGGSSMGSATALYAAARYPERVKGLIMAKPPTGWEERENRKRFLLSSAKRLQDIEEEEGNGGVSHQVLIGAANANFPPLKDEAFYQQIQCPVLILALRGDEAHPESTAFALERIIPQAELHFASSYNEAEAHWPRIIQAFISKIAV